MFDSAWLFGRWEPVFVAECKPSIEFLELYALCMGVFVWIERLANRRIILYCDNEVIVAMVNSSTSSCKYCMVLIRKLVLKCLCYNTRVITRHLKGIHNQYSDFLSRMRIDHFKNWARRINHEIDATPMDLSQELWPLMQYWKEKCAPLL